VGCTCYLNTAIQCISYCEPFLKFVLENQKGILLKELRDLLYELFVNNNNIIPRRFVSKVREICDFPVYQQNDINEFLAIFIDKLNNDICETVNINIRKHDGTTYDMQRYYMDSDWAKQVSKEYSEIVPMFYGQSIMQIQCGHCQNITHNYELFCNIMLPIQGNTLYDCIDAYFSNELMDYWTCDECSSKAKSKKMNRLWRMPKILIISLKRFSDDMNKNNKKVEIPLELNLNKYLLTKNTSYKLKSVAIHQGTLNNGHYYAIVEKENRWFEIDDLNVKLLDDPTRYYEQGYVYFYVKT
jgi:ubiquitin C-terminal hydrolase